MTGRGGWRAGGIVGAVLAALIQGSQPAMAACRFELAAELPVIMLDSRPTVEAGIDGAKARFVLDSGAQISQMTAAQAGAFKLRTRSAPFRWMLAAPFWQGEYASDGTLRFKDEYVAYVKRLDLAGLSFRDFEFGLIAGEFGDGQDGLLGQDLLGPWDVEYDLGQGSVRLFKARGCHGQHLPYWISPGQAYSAMSIDRPTNVSSPIQGLVYLNGVRVRAIFDTGAATSLLALSAAQRAGVGLGSPGVSAADPWRSVVGGSFKTYVATFASFKIGDGEEIHDARLRIADIRMGDAEMLIGADFFLSHRILVASRQHRIYVTYDGGPVFALALDSADRRP